MTREPLPFAGAALVDDGAPSGPGLRELAGALRARWRTLAAGAAAGAVLCAAVSFVLPPVYVASVSVLEAPRPGGNSALDQLGLSAQMLGFKSGSGSNALTYPDILRSRRLIEGLLATAFPTRDGRRVRLDDWLVPGRPSPQRTDRAVDALRRRFDVALDRRTNLLRLGVSDRDPVLAAHVANAACASLQDLVMRSMMTQAGANRRFVETRLEEARGELARAEGAMQAFREGNRHVDDSPRLLLEQARLVREVRTREEVVIALTREYEMARVDENRDVPVLNVLDAAEPPAFRSAPRRGALTAAGLALGLAIGAALAWPRRTTAADVTAPARAA